jgi:hypothetical protein
MCSPENGLREHVAFNQRLLTSSPTMGPWVWMIVWIGTMS